MFLCEFIVRIRMIMFVYIFLSSLLSRTIWVHRAVRKELVRSGVVLILTVTYVYNFVVDKDCSCL